MSRGVLPWIALLFIVMGATGVWFGIKMLRPPEATQSGSEAIADVNYLKTPADSSQPWLTEFTLTNQTGKQVHSKDLAGKVYVTNFFFSSCPGTCLQQNQKVLEIAGEYGPKGVQFLSITCDPEIDTPSRLREYAEKLGANHEHWHFLTGDLGYVKRVAAEVYQIPLDKQTHSERFFVTDKWGNIRGNFAWNKLDEITQLKLLLEKLQVEQKPPSDLPKKPTITLTPHNPEAE